MKILLRIFGSYEPYLFWKHDERANFYVHRQHKHVCVQYANLVKQHLQHIIDKKIFQSIPVYSTYFYRGKA